MKKQEDIYYYLKTWDGQTVRVPHNRLKDWEKEQEKQKKSAQESKTERTPEEFIQKMQKLLGL